MVSASTARFIATVSSLPSTTMISLIIKIIPFFINSNKPANMQKEEAVPLLMMAYLIKYYDKMMVTRSSA
jgi:hypothetical protein